MDGQPQERRGSTTHFFVAADLLISKASLRLMVGSATILSGWLAMVASGCGGAQGLEQLAAGESAMGLLCPACPCLAAARRCGSAQPVSAARYACTQQGRRLLQQPMKMVIACCCCCCHCIDQQPALDEERISRSRT